MPVRMVPLLPCASIDEMADFGSLLGLRVAYRQIRPNPYLALERADGLVLHYYGMPDVRFEDSHSSCVAVVERIEPVFEEFAAALRTRYGKLPLVGYPRITRPRRRKNNDQRMGFSLIDPAGNWIRFTAAHTNVGSTRAEPLTDAVDNAVVLADSHGDVGQAYKILAGALRRHRDTADAVAVQQAEDYLVELDSRRSD